MTNEGVRLLSDPAYAVVNGDDVLANLAVQRLPAEMKCGRLWKDSDLESSGSSAAVQGADDSVQTTRSRYVGSRAAACDRLAS